jgi:hypothetical protein
MNRRFGDFAKAGANEGKMANILQFLLESWNAEHFY